MTRGADRPLARVPGPPLPAFVTAEAGSTGRVLFLAGAADGSIRYELAGAGGPTLGSGDLAAPDRQQARLDGIVRDLLAARGGPAVGALSTYAVRYVAVAGPAAAQIDTALDGQPGLDPDPYVGDVRLWRVAPPSGRFAVLPAALAAAAAATPAPTADQLAAAPPRPLTPPLSASAEARADRLVGPGRSFGPVVVPAGEPGRLLVLAEAASGRWRARLDGQPLPARVAWGWAQAFPLPPAGGRVVVSAESRTRHRDVLVQAGLLAVVAVLAAPAANRRRDGRRSGGDHPDGRRSGGDHPDGRRSGGDHPHAGLGPVRW